MNLEIIWGRQVQFLTLIRRSIVEQQHAGTWAVFGQTRFPALCSLLIRNPVEGASRAITFPTFDCVGAQAWHGDNAAMYLFSIALFATSWSAYKERG